MVAQVGDPGTIAVSGREVDPIGSRQHLFQIPVLIGKGLPQVKVDTALVCGQLCQLLVHRAQDIGRKTGLFRSSLGPHRRDGLDIDDAAGQGLPELIQHLAIVGQKAVCCPQRGQRVGAQQDIELFRLGRCQHIHCHL